MADRKLLFYYSISFFIVIATSLCFFGMTSFFIKNLAPFVISDEDIETLQSREFTFETTKRLALKLEESIGSINDKLLRVVIYICLYFMSVSAHIISSSLGDYSNLVISYLFRNNIIITIPSIILIIFVGNLLFYSFIYSLSSILSCFISKLNDVRSFCRKFSWYLVAIQLFITFVPIVPTGLLYSLFAILGVPVECYLFGVIVSSLPDIYIHYRMGKTFLVYTSNKFIAEYNYLICIICSIGITLFICIVFTIRLYKNTQRTAPNKDNKKEKSD